MTCGVCKTREGNKIKAGCKTFLFCEECFEKAAKQLKKWSETLKHRSYETKKYF